MNFINRISVILFFFFGLGLANLLHAGNIYHMLQYVDSVLTNRYYHANIDSLYIVRPKTKWTLMGRLNFFGSEIRVKGLENGKRFNAEMDSDYKSTLSLGVSYLGLSVNLSLNPAKMLGHYKDFEINLSSYGRRMGFDFVYQDANSYTGWHEAEGQERIALSSDLLSLKTLNLNAYYAFNNRQFANSAAFAKSYIQHRSAGSFMLAASIQGQRGKVKRNQNFMFSMINFGVGAGYAYNYVPASNWLLHISALPTFIVYSDTSFRVDDSNVPMNYHFPEVIITGRAGVVKQFGNKFLGLSMVFNFTNIGNEDNLSVYNQKWRSRLYYGFRF